MKELLMKFRFFQKEENLTEDEALWDYEIIDLIDYGKIKESQ